MTVSMTLQRNISNRAPWYPLVIFISTFCGSATSLADENHFRLAFGSCLNQNLPAPALEEVIKRQPDAFLMLGDNVYETGGESTALMAAYQKLLTRESFQRIRNAMPLLAVWDDNDYGEKDGGADFGGKAQSKAIFLDAFAIAENNPVRFHPGLYQSYLFGEPGKQIQLILLDTRWFRSPLKRAPQVPRYHGPYIPTSNVDATILGEEQWHWLETELRRPAQIRLIASSIQVLADEHGFETWGNFPGEQQRLFSLIRKTKAAGVIFLSGDRHHAELSRFLPPDLYPLYDFTASSFNMDRGDFPEKNRLRIGNRVTVSNFGEVEISFVPAGAQINLRIFSAAGNEVSAYRLDAAELDWSTK